MSGKVDAFIARLENIDKDVLVLVAMIEGMRECNGGKSPLPILTLLIANGKTREVFLNEVRRLSEAYEQWLEWQEDEEYRDDPEWQKWNKENREIPDLEDFSKESKTLFCALDGYFPMNWMGIYYDDSSTRDFQSWRAWKGYITENN